MTLTTRTKQAWEIDLSDLSLTIFFPQCIKSTIVSFLSPPRCSGVFDLSILEVESTEETGPTPHTGDALLPAPLLIVCTSLL